MASKIVSASLVLILNIAFGVVTLVMMLIAMNGYSESDATPGLVTFIVIAAGSAIAMAAGALPFAIGGKILLHSLRT